MESSDTQKQINSESVERASKIARETLDLIEKQRQANQHELVGSFVIAKILDIFAILLLVVVIIIVVILFSRSLFEGFVSSIVGFWLVKYVFIKRSNDLLSKFQGWF